MGTPKMIRTFAILAALATIASPAAAETQIRVKIVGKDAKTIQAEIRKAAEVACWEDFRGGDSIYISPLKACVEDSVARAMQQIPPAQLAEAGA